MRELKSVLESIANENIVFTVNLDSPDWFGSKEFILGPPEICGNVLGLVDPEYGWPVMVDLNSVTSIRELAPSHRRHPFVYLNGECVAVGIQMTEYAEIKARIGADRSTDS